MTASRESGGTSHVLPEERAKASFSLDKLQAALGTGGRAKRVADLKHLFEDPVFDASMDHYRSYADLFEVRLERASKAMQILRENPKLEMMHKSQKVSMGDFFETGPLGIHFVAFLPFLQTQATDEQKKKWLNGALNAKYWAAYAQTELGHGSNLRALETTATYDKDADEFVIDSPKLTSMKWWPTAMYSSTHGVVFAQLIVGGKNCGVFGFFMQFRKPDGTLMPGVEIGEIGPKMSSGDTIGYGRFDHVRVPRFNMFSKHAKVTREGEFVPAPAKLSKFKYVGMMNIRAGMVSGAGHAAARAATVAVRYSCVRKQGFQDSVSEDALSGGENAIIEYKVQQYRLFKALGLSHLCFWTGRVVNDFLARVVAGVAKGDESAADDLPELHATLAGLKATCTSWSHAAIEDCRKACGGQGVLRSSGIADASTGYAGAVTAEGEQIILGLQTARYLIKIVSQFRGGKGAGVPASVQYLGGEPLAPVRLDQTEPGRVTAVLAALIQDRARRVAQQLQEDFTAAERKGLPFDKALNSVAVLAYHAAECHCMHVMTRNMAEALGSAKYMPDAAVRAALTRLLQLAMCQQIREKGGDFVDVLGSAQQRWVLGHINALMDDLRPDAVALTDGWGYTDSALKSTLGRHDGNVYEAIYAEAKKSPLNTAAKMVGWDKMAPRLDADFMRANMAVQRQGAKL